MACACYSALTYKVLKGIGIIGLEALGAKQPHGAGAVRLLQHLVSVYSVSHVGLGFRVYLYRGRLLEHLLQARVIDELTCHTPQPATRGPQNSTLTPPRVPFGSTHGVIEIDTCDTEYTLTRNPQR